LSRIRSFAGAAPIWIGLIGVVEKRGDGVRVIAPFNTVTLTLHFSGLVFCAAARPSVPEVKANLSTPTVERAADFKPSLPVSVGVDDTQRPLHVL
jgi:hypothetical protein